ncbi:MAG: lipoyl synthase [Holosporales bacterium]|jgi:lipoic acid synthetase|nr:lipoyl synthase [Holosporales bacterium]
MPIVESYEIDLIALWAAAVRWYDLRICWVLLDCVPIMSGHNQLCARPKWIRAKASDSSFEDTIEVVRANKVCTVCEEALCPNIGECWRNKTATFLIMGDTCTRACGFCNIKSGCPSALDPSEPHRVADTIKALGIKYAVVTSVTRDDLPDGGASHFADVIAAIRETVPDVRVEVLTPDFKGSHAALEVISNAAPDVFAHNIEIVRRLHSQVKRPPSNYDTSLLVLKTMKEIRKDAITKTGLIVGVGESDADVRETIHDVSAHNVDILTIGQYLTPTTAHHPIARYVTIEEFNEYRSYGEELGVNVIAGPLVRSSYNAVEAYEQVCRQR